MLPSFVVDYGERNCLIHLGEIKALSLKNASWCIVSFLAHYIETLLSSNICMYVRLNTDKQGNKEPRLSIEIICPGLKL